MGIQGTRRHKGLCVAYESLVRTAQGKQKAKCAALERPTTSPLGMILEDVEEEEEEEEEDRKSTR